MNFIMCDTDANYVNMLETTLSELFDYYHGSTLVNKNDDNKMILNGIYGLHNK